MTLDIQFTNLHRPEKGNIVLFSFENDEGGDSVKVINKIIHNALDRAMKADNYTGKFGQVCKLVSPDENHDYILVVGLGMKDKFSVSKAKEAGGIAVQALQRKVESFHIMADWDFTEYAGYLVLGAVLKNYEFKKYCLDKSKKDEFRQLKAIKIMASDYEGAQKQWTDLSAVADGVYLTRDLVNEPANQLNPAEFVNRIKKLESLGLMVEVINKEKMQELGFGALLGVAQGSNNEPYTVVMQWKGNPDDKDPPLAFLGKGVTFDSGGISLKPANGMEDMKMDMAGAATVTGLMSVLAKRKAKVNVIGVVGLVENMVSGHAQRPGDIVRSASGQTIEVLNTDAEGRLVLADLLWYTQDRFKPRFMVNLATLTGAMVVALGYEYAGLFSNDDELAGKLSTTGHDSGEKLWRMPMGDAYDRAINSDFADMKNIGGRDGGSITAAQFLKRFVNDTPWAHLDIAGTAYTAKSNYCGPKGATAFGVNLLNHFVETYYEK